MYFLHTGHSESHDFSDFLTEHVEILMRTSVLQIRRLRSTGCQGLAESHTVPVWSLQMNSKLCSVDTAPLKAYGIDKETLDLPSEAKSFRLYHVLIGFPSLSHVSLGKAKTSQADGGREKKGSTTPVLPE